MKKIVLLIAFCLTVTACSHEERELADSEEILNEVDCGKITEEMKSDILQIFNHLNEGEMKELKNRLNETVLTSKDTLENEMTTVHNHTCIELEDVEDDNLFSEEKMEMYLLMLEYYYTIMEDQSELRVDQITFDDPDDYFIFRLSAKMESGNHAEVELFPGSMANSSYLHRENDLLRELLESAPSDAAVFFKNEFADRSLHALADPVTEAFNRISGYREEKAEHGWETEIRENRSASGLLDLQFAIFEGDGNAFWHDEELRKIELYPSRNTYFILERWEDVSDVVWGFPYPDEGLIHTEEWLELSDFYYENNTDMDVELMDYISSGLPSRYDTFEEFIDELELE